MFHHLSCHRKFPEAVTKHFRFDFKGNILLPVMDSNFYSHHFRDNHHLAGLGSVEFLSVSLDVSEEGFLGLSKSSFEGASLPCSEKTHEFLHVQFLDFIPGLSSKREFCHIISLLLSCPPRGDGSHLPSWWSMTGNRWTGFTMSTPPKRVVNNIHSLS